MEIVVTNDSKVLQQTRAATIDHVPVSPDDAAATARGSRRRSPNREISARTPDGWAVSDDARIALEKCELFQDVSGPRLMEVAALVEESSLQPDEKLLHEGEPARYLFVIVEGRGIAHLKLDQGWISLGLVGPGEVAGWSSLIDGQLYPATVKVMTPMRVARIETRGLMLLMNLEPEIGYPIHKRLSSIFYRQYQAALAALQTSV